MTPEIETEPGPTWGYQDIGLFLALSLMCMAVVQVAGWGVVHALHLGAQDRALVLMPSQIVLYALLVGVLFAIVKLQYGRQVLPALGWVDFRFSAGGVVLMGLLLAVFNALASVLLRTPQLDTPMKHLFDRRITAIEFGLIGTTLAPLCEELVFRGFLQPVLVQSFGPAFGILISAGLFGALHLAQNGFAWQAGVLITVAGLAFGWMRHVSGSTKASTLMHAAYNFILFLAAFGQTSKPT
jgi:membrane protease YdiL (CAAX protease family)